METLIGIIIALCIFTIIVFIHELGHFLAARFFSVKVEEFGIGIPPRAKKMFYDKKGTLFSLNWLPIGGFVRLKGESGNNKEKGSLQTVSYFGHSIILLAGVCMNFLLACIIFSLLFFIGVQPIGINTVIDTHRDIKLIPTYETAIKNGVLLKDKGLVLSPIPDSISEQSGIQKGDVVTSLNGEEIDDIKVFVDTINSNYGQQISLSITPHCPPCQNGQQCKLCAGKKEVLLTIGEDGKIGTYIGENITFNSEFQYKYSLLHAVKYGFLETYNQSILTLIGLKSLVQKIFVPKDETQRQEAISQVSGPVGLVSFISQSLGAGIGFLFIISAIISINLGVFNLLPIPALDGGRFFILTIQKVSKKIFKKQVLSIPIENIIHIFFFIILIALSIIIAYNDIYKIITN